MGCSSNTRGIQTPGVAPSNTRPAAWSPAPEASSCTSTSAAWRMRWNFWPLMVQPSRGNRADRVAARPVGGRRTWPSVALGPALSLGGRGDVSNISVVRAGRVLSFPSSRPRWAILGGSLSGRCATAKVLVEPTRQRWRAGQDHRTRRRSWTCSADAHAGASCASRLAKSVNHDDPRQFTAGFWPGVGASSGDLAAAITLPTRTSTSVDASSGGTILAPVRCEQARRKLPE